MVIPRRGSALQSWQRVIKPNGLEKLRQVARSKSSVLGVCQYAWLRNAKEERWRAMCRWMSKLWSDAGVSCGVPYLVWVTLIVLQHVSLSSRLETVCEERLDAWFLRHGLSGLFVKRSSPRLEGGRSLFNRAACLCHCCQLAPCDPFNG